MGHSKLAYILLFFALTPACWGQAVDGTANNSASSDNPPAGSAQKSTAGDDVRPASDNPAQFLRNLALDQKAIWTSPFKAKIGDLNWLVPLAGLTAGLINADAEL